MIIFVLFQACRDKGNFDEDSFIENEKKADAVDSLTTENEKMQTIIKEHEANKKDLEEKIIKLNEQPLVVQQTAKP